MDSTIGDYYEMIADALCNHDFQEEIIEALTANGMEIVEAHGLAQAWVSIGPKERLHMSLYEPEKVYRWIDEMMKK